ncbi:MAG: sugar phosphate isomerase/epimerase [Kiritimatiellaeota bacterium]|nr:sugar phosphate isomerase/epimerase [Kiritimatiellota bacterium]
MLRPGLVSITFRKLSPETIVQLAAGAGLEGIEWGGDVHVPHGDTARAREVRALTEAAGLRVSSYGSYYRVGATREFTFPAVQRTALALGAPLIRIWAGDRGSDRADAPYWSAVVRDARALCTEAAQAGIGVAFEFHRNTLTDSTAAALELIRRIEHPNARLYWQPPAGMAEDALLESLEAVLPVLANLHVFHWNGSGNRLPLSEGRERWRSLFARVEDAPKRQERWALLEFVKDDAPAALAEDALALRELIAGNTT